MVIECVHLLSFVLFKKGARRVKGLNIGTVNREITIKSALNILLQGFDLIFKETYQLVFLRRGQI